MELTVQDNKTSMYITDQNQTLQYTANVYNSITTFADSDEVVLRGSVDDSAEVEYSANGYEGVEIDENGLLTITPQAQPGTVTVSASYGEITKTAQLELEEISDADGVVIAGDELVRKGGSYEFKALPTAGGTVIPERDTEWSIEGDARGCSIENGMLTVPQDAEPGNITIKAALTVSGSQTSENVFDTMTVTIKDDEALSPYSVNGVFLENCAADISQAAGYRGTQTEVSSDTVNKNMSEGINGYMSVGNIFVDFDMPQDSVSVTGTPSGQLIVAGYDQDGRIIKTDVIDGYTAELTEYSDCRTIRAFLWNNIEDMQPVCESQSVTLE